MIYYLLGFPQKPYFQFVNNSLLINSIAFIIKNCQKQIQFLMVDQENIALIILEMREKCWKQLKSQLCPKERWVKDDDTSKCLCCNKEFRMLVRRKHHCRFCGNIFCSDCSDHYLNGNYLGLPDEKYVRHCEFCHKKINKFISEFAKTPEIFGDDNLENSEDSAEEQDEENFNLNKMFEDIEKNSCMICNKLEEQIQSTVDERANQLCEKFSIDSKVWKQKLADITYRAATEARMDALSNQGNADAMDIAKQVRVKTVVTDGNKSIHALVRGIVLEKNPISKHQNLHLSKPQVMVVENSIDLDSFSSFVKFEELIKNQRQYLKKIMEKIVRVHPDIIFVEKHVHVYALEYLQENRITVVSKVKQKTLDVIRELAGIKKPVKKLWRLEKYKKPQILGKCDKIYFKAMKEGQSLMFMQSDMGMRTIVLGDQREQVSTLLKRSAQILLRLSRQIFLEKQWILTDQQLIGNCPKAVITTLQDFDLQKKYSSVQKFLAGQELNITKIIYKQKTFDQVPKTYNDYAQKMELFYKYFKEPCGYVDYLTRKLYTNADLSFGAFLILSVANSQRPCSKCQTNHRVHYYHRGKVFVVETQRIKESDDDQLRGHQYASSFIEEFPNQEELTLDKLKNHLIKCKELVVIENSIRCLNCSKRISCKENIIKLGKLYLSNSFYYILERLVDESNRLDEIEASRDSNNSDQLPGALKSLKKRIPSLKCSHDFIGRVYQYSGIRVKIYIEPVALRVLDEIKFKDPKSQQHILHKENIFVKKQEDSEIVEKLSLLQKIKAKLNDLPFPINTSSSVSIHPKVMMAFEYCSKLKQILQKCEAELQDIKSESIAQTNTPVDWTLLIRRILKVQRVIQLSFLIVDQIQISLRKKKAQQYVKNQNIVPIAHRSFSSSSSQSLLMTQQKEDGISETSQSMEAIEDTLLKPEAFATFVYDPESSRTIEPPTPTFPFKKQESYLDADIRDYLKVLNKKRFPRVQGVYFHFCPALITEPISLLASAFNSSEFKKALQEEIENIKRSSRGERNPQQVGFRMHMLRKIKTEWAVKAEADKLYSEVVGDNPDKIEIVEFIFYYPVEFEELRKREGIENDLYLRALYSCKSWESSGGKTNSKFAKAENDLLVIKVINEKQFEEFLKFVEDYLHYLKKHRSLLAKIFGIYQVSAKGRIYKCVVMENIFFGLEKITKVYDLKGSEVNRLVMPSDSTKSFTGQDTNFIIDKDGEPYILNQCQHNILVTTLEGDSIFLRAHEVIDYSLLVIESENRLRLGIIDYMRPYHTIEKIQNIYKEFKSGKDPTVIPPASYAERFLNAMKRYFIKIQ